MKTSTTRYSTNDSPFGIDPIGNPVLNTPRTKRALSWKWLFPTAVLLALCLALQVFLLLEHARLTNNPARAFILGGLVLAGLACLMWWYWYRQPRQHHERRHQTLNERLDDGNRLFFDGDFQTALLKFHEAEWCDDCGAFLPEAISCQSLCHCMLGNFHQSMHYTELAVLLEPEDPDILIRYATLLVSSPVDSHRQSDRARTVLAAISPAGDEHRNLRDRLQAIVHAAEGKWDQAIERYTECVKSDSGGVPRWYSDWVLGELSEHRLPLLTAENLQRQFTESVQQESDIPADEDTHPS